MSDFLLIVPNEWTQLDWAYLTNKFVDISPSYVNNCAVSNTYADMEAMFKADGLIPEAASLVECKLLDEFFMVRLVY